MKQIYNGKDTHFAVNKFSKLIVFAWDYSDVEPYDLRNFRKDYFIVDLEDNGFNAKDYKILTFKMCVATGVDPRDNANWSNDGVTSCVPSEKNEAIKHIQKLVKEAVENEIGNEFYNEEDSEGKTGQPNQVKSYDIGYMTTEQAKQSAAEENMSLSDYLKFWWEEVGNEVPFTWQTLGQGYGYHGDTIAKIGNVVIKDIYGQIMIDEHEPTKNITETTRRQKAQQAIQGKNRKVKTIAIISAQNPMGNVSTEEYNKDAHNDLLKSLKIGQFRYFETDGLYGSPEKSVLVYNISLDDTLFLCYKYNQESVIFIDMTDANQISYQYWEGDKHNTPLKLQHEENEIVDATNDKDYYTKISNKFKFRIPFFEDVKRYNTELVECSKHNDVDYLLENILSDKKTRYSKYMHRGKLKSLLKRS